MDTGRLNMRVSIERNAQYQDPVYGSLIDVWIPTYSVWAAIEPLQGREYIAAMMVRAERTVRITMRYLPGIDSTMRVVYLGRVFAIQSIINPGEANRELQLMTLEQV